MQVVHARHQAHPAALVHAGGAAWAVQVIAARKRAGPVREVAASLALHARCAVQIVAASTPHDCIRGVVIVAAASEE